MAANDPNANSNLPAILGDYEEELRRAHDVIDRYENRLNALERRNQELESGKFRAVGAEMLASGAIFDPPISGSDIATLSYNRGFTSSGYNEAWNLTTHPRASSNPGNPFGSGVRSDGQPRTSSGTPRVYRRGQNG